MIIAKRAPGRSKIDGHWYFPGEWYANKAEAKAKADRLRKTGYFKGVRVVPRIVDRRYARYYVYTR